MAADEIALMLLYSEQETLREIGLEVACGLCSEAGMRCECDGHSCVPDDLTVDPVETHLVCGMVILRDFRVLPWGAAVRQLQ